MLSPEARLYVLAPYDRRELSQELRESHYVGENQITARVTFGSAWSLEGQ